MRHSRNISILSALIFLSCIFVIVTVKMLRNKSISSTNEVLLNNSIANFSAQLDEFRDLVSTEFELENMNIKDFELVNSNNFKLELNSIESNSEGLYLLYFPKIMCDKCIQEEIQKVYEKCDTMSNFYSIIPLNVAREIRSVYKSMNEGKFFYYDENFLLLKEPVKPIFLHLDKNYIVDRAFVIQKINIEFNEKFLNTL
jgi:hypothetical protein